MTTPAGDPDWARLLAAARRSLERTGGSLDRNRDDHGTIRRRTAACYRHHRRAPIGRGPAAHGATGRAGRLPDAGLWQGSRRSGGRSGWATPSGPARRAPTRGRRAGGAAASGQLEHPRRRGLVPALAGRARRRRHPHQDRAQRVGLRRGGPGARRLAGPPTNRLRRSPSASSPTPKHSATPPCAGWYCERSRCGRDSDPATTAEQERALWESVGVVPDDLASQVLVLNIPATGGLVADWLRQATAVGLPVRLTLHQLRSAPVVVVATEMFVTENPAVLRAASHARLRGAANGLHRGGAVGRRTPAARQRTGDGVVVAERLRLARCTHDHRCPGPLPNREAVAHDGGRLPRRGWRGSIPGRFANLDAVGSIARRRDGPRRSSSDGGATTRHTDRRPSRAELTWQLAPLLRETSTRTVPCGRSLSPGRMRQPLSVPARKQRSCRGVCDAEAAVRR